ncbi:MAG: fumarylacetoacetate hydrolase family protein [Bacteroidota bacterium]
MEFAKIRNNDEKIRIGKVICVGRNYAAHAAELGNEIPEFPIIFLKTASCLVESGSKIIHPPYSTDMHHEIELVLVIGETVKNADDISAENAIYGYAVGLDMTLRDIQNKLKDNGQPWTLAKVFDTSGVISEVVLKENFKLTGTERIYLDVNGKILQDSTLDLMLFSPVEIVKFISSKMTLEKGDLILTGTPSGVGKVVPGDKMEGGIEGVGLLSAVVSE